VRRRALKQAGNLSKISEGLYDELLLEICMNIRSCIGVRNVREGSYHGLGIKTHAGGSFFRHHVKLVLLERWKQTLYVGSQNMLLQLLIFKFYLPWLRNIKIKKKP
jgi:hypothetical protein